MRIAIIGRTETLYETAELLQKQGHSIALIITSKEAPEYTKTSDDFQHLANSWGIPFIRTPKIEETIETIKNLPLIDIGVSLNYSGVIPESVISLFPLGILNAHGGDLPRYRGNACQAWAIINGEEKIGLCVHRMIGGELDSGNIIARDYYPVTTSTKITEVYQWMDAQIPALFSDAVTHLSQDSNFVIECQSKDPKQALRCYPRQPEDGQINWNKSAIEILRLINASNKPFGGAFCDFEGEKLIIWDAKLAADENFLAIPGQVTMIGNGFIEVATNEGKVRLFLVEYKGEEIAPNKLIKSIRTRLK